MLELAGRGAIIAGTKRVGAIVAQRLAVEGIRLAITYRSSREEAEKLYELTREMTDRACLIQADLTVEADVKRVVEEAKQQLGDLSFCINLASDYPRVPLEELDAAAWEHGLTPAKATYLLALHASRAMQSNPTPTRGHLIFFSDWAAGVTPYTEFLPYLTSKAAIDFMTRAFALELAPWGILVNTILPGPTAGVNPSVTDNEWQQAMAETPLHRESSAEEIAEMIVTLLKLETMTGASIHIDAGRHIAGAGVPKPAV